MELKICQRCGNGLMTKAEQLVGECIRCASRMTVESRRPPAIKPPRYAFGKPKTVA